MVVVPREILEDVPRFSLYNSPYHAHDQGHAIDLYYRTPSVPSPVSGRVVIAERVAAPSRSYAAACDYLLGIDTGSVVARILHVEPTVSVGAVVEVGEVIGSMVTSGYAAPWVPDHMHLELRERDTDLRRARGGVSLMLDVPVVGVEWDGVGTVVEVGATYVVLDEPAGAGGAGVVGVAADGGGVLDGGVPHYSGGGLFGGSSGPVGWLGERIGWATGRDVAWADVAVTVDGVSVVGVSLSLGWEGRGVKVVCPDREFEVGDEVEVGVG